MNDLISVIIPVYKAEPYLRRCVDSVLAQTHVNLQVILVDDGSPDGSGAICDAYAEQDARVLVVHKENGGPGSARNAGLEVATGEYVGFVDSDDVVAPKMYETLLQNLHETKTDLAYVGIQCFQDKIGEFRQSNRVQVVHDPAKWFLQKNHLYFTVCFLYPRFLIGKQRFAENMRVAEDQEFLLRFSQCVQSIAVSTFVGYYYYQNIDSLSNGALDERHYDDLRLRNRAVDSVEKRLRSAAKGHLAKGMLAYAVKALVVGSTCERPIEREYPSWVRRHILRYWFGVNIGWKRRVAATLFLFGNRLPAKCLRGAVLS